MRRALIHSPAFLRSAKRFVKKRPEAKEAIRTTLTDLEGDAYAPHLKTHKLQGDLTGCWTSSAGYDLRIVFQVIEQNKTEAILLLSVGTHDEVY